MTKTKKKTQKKKVGGGRKRTEQLTGQRNKKKQNNETNKCFKYIFGRGKRERETDHKMTIFINQKQHSLLVAQKLGSKRSSKHIPTYGTFVGTKLYCCCPSKPSQCPQLQVCQWATLMPFLLCLFDQYPALQNLLNEVLSKEEGNPKCCESMF